MKHLILFFALCFFAFSEAPFKPTPIEIGAKAPDFSLLGTDDKTYTLSSFAESDYLAVIFTANHCPDARAARDRMNTFAKEFAEKGVATVAISSNNPEALQVWEHGYCVYNDDFEGMKAVAEEHSFIYPYLYDGDTQEVGKAYGALATPHCFLFNKERELIYHGAFDNGRRSKGPASKKNLEAALTEHMAGKEITEPITRAHGCSTKWIWKKDLVAKELEAWKKLPVMVEALDAEAAAKLAKNETKNIRLFNIWSTTCAPCIAEFPDLIDTYRRYGRRPFEFITISTDPKDDAENVIDFLKDIHLPVVKQGVKHLKKDGRTTNNYHYQGEDLDALAEALDSEWQGPLPHTFLVMPNGEVSYRHSGQVDPIALRKAIVKALESL